MKDDYGSWALAAIDVRSNWNYSYSQWATDVLKAVSEGKPVDARIVALAKSMVHPTKAVS
jgi:hypothetical protein